PTPARRPRRRPTAGEPRAAARWRRSEPAKMLRGPSPMKTKLKRGTHWFAVVVAVSLLGPIATLAFGPVSLSRDWRTASQASSQQAPDPATHDEAIVQVYAGRTYGWRGAFAVHTWLAAKAAGADRYTRYEVIGWYLRSGHSSVS